MHGLRLQLRLTAAAALLAVGSAWPQAGPSETLIGWEHLRNNRFAAAAEAWGRVSAQAAQRRSNEGTREAAYASVLSAIAHERAGDARAYARWAEAVRLYLEAGSSWERDRERLRASWRNLERQLAQAATGAPPELSGDEQMLVDLVSRAGLLDYNGPRANLVETRDGSRDLSNITPQYFAGAGGADTSDAIAQSELRYGTLEFAQQTSANALTRFGTQLVGSPSISETAAEPAGQVVASPPERETLSSPPTSRSFTTPLPSSADLDQAPDVPAQASAAFALTGPGTPLLQRIRLNQADAPTEPTSSAIAREGGGLPRLFQGTRGAPRVLSADERATAQVAWRYVLANRQSGTGLVNGKDSYPVSSVADVAQTIAAYNAALALQFIEREEFTADMRQLLTTLRDLPLYNQELFNREYDSRSGRMLDLSARSSAVGSGWSADDIGRLLLWLRVLANAVPDLAPHVEAVVARLRLSRLVAGGRLHSTLLQGEREEVIDDLRLGRQQLTAAALSLWGVVLPQMFSYEDALLRRAAGVVAPADRRGGGTVAPDAFARGLVEIGGLDGCFKAAARSALDAQHALAAEQRRSVMVADELLDQTPWFVYGALASGGEAWRVASFDRQPRPDLANFSVKAAFLWSAVDKAPATLAARGLAESLERSERGLYGGRYVVAGKLNVALTLNTNATVLVTSWYAQRGGQPILRIDTPVEPSCPGLQTPPA